VCRKCECKVKKMKHRSWIRELRDIGIDQTEFSSEERMTWVRKARGVAYQIAKKRGSVTAEDVRKACPPDDRWDPRILGAVFRPGKRSPWRRVGWQEGTRACAHGRPIAVWALEDKS
jgi:hypothetical protein